MYKDISFKSPRNAFSQAALLVPRRYPQGKVERHHGLPPPLYFQSYLYSAVLFHSRVMLAYKPQEGCVSSACSPVPAPLLAPSHLWVGLTPTTLCSRPLKFWQQLPREYAGSPVFPLNRFYSSQLPQVEEPMSWAPFCLNSLWINSLSYLSLDLTFTQCSTTPGTSSPPPLRPRFYRLSLTFGIKGLAKPVNPLFDPLEAFRQRWVMYLQMYCLQFKCTACYKPHVFCVYLLYSSPWLHGPPKLLYCVCYFLSSLTDGCDLFHNGYIFRTDFSEVQVQLTL